MSSQSKTAQQPVSGKNADKVFKGVAYACGILILVVLAAVALFLLFRAWPLIGGDQQANQFEADGVAQAVTGITHHLSLYLSLSVDGGQCIAIIR